MKKIVLFLITVLCLSACTGNNTVQEQECVVKSEYWVQGSSNMMKIYVFEIENHEYIGDPYADYFIHSPNCKCLCSSQGF